MVAHREDPQSNGEGAVEEPGAEPARSLRAWLDGAPLPRLLHLALGLFMPAALLIASMWRVSPFTIDDAYISYRYARNLARGLGLVYNAGERIEGYTNFLWTLLLAAGALVGLDPDALAKVLGGAAACGALGVVYLLERRVLPLRSLPCLGPWLLASSIAFSGYAVFGLETPLFALLVLAGTELLFRESDREAALGSPPLAWLATRAGFPVSGLLFALAGLTRPEAPLFLGIPMLFLGLRFFRPQNLLRGALFVAPIALHMLWRHGYYGTWLPNTLSAKTGNLEGQIQGGARYLGEYLAHAWPALLLALYGLCVAMVTRHRRALCLGVLAVLVGVYVLLVGGDWMPYYRFLATFEPYAFVLAGLGGRALGDFLVAWTAARRARRARGGTDRPSIVVAALAALAALAARAAGQTAPRSSSPRSPRSPRSPPSRSWPSSPRTAAACSSAPKPASSATRRSSGTAPPAAWPPGSSSAASPARSASATSATSATPPTTPCSTSSASSIR